MVLVGRSIHERTQILRRAPFTVDEMTHVQIAEAVATWQQRSEDQSLAVHGNLGVELPRSLQMRICRGRSCIHPRAKSLTGREAFTVALGRVDVVVLTGLREDWTARKVERSVGRS